MSACRYCGCSSWLFGLGDSGLCGTCEHLVSSELEQRAKVIARSERDAETTQNASTKLDRLDLVVAQLEAVAAYERKGIRTPIESAERRLKEAQRERDALLMRAAKEDLDATMTAVRSEADPELKSKRLSDFLLRLRDYCARAGSKGPLPALERKVRASAWRVRLSAALERAARAEHAGRRAEAASAYREALTFLGSAEAAGPAAVEQRLRVLDRLATLDAGSPA